MLRVHTADGLTRKVDLRDEAQARALLSSVRSPAFQHSLTAVTVVQCPRDEEHQCAVTRPDGFRDVFFEFEDVAAGRGGERLVVQADDVRLLVMAHRERPCVRISLLKVGRRRYNPIVA